MCQGLTPRHPVYSALFLSVGTLKKWKKKNLVAGWKSTWCELKTRRLPSASRKAVAYRFLSWFACNDIVGTFLDLTVLGDKCFPSFSNVPCPSSMPSAASPRAWEGAQRGLPQTALCSHGSPSQLPRVRAEFCFSVENYPLFLPKEKAVLGCLPLPPSEAVTTSWPTRGQST